MRLAPPKKYFDLDFLLPGFESVSEVRKRATDLANTLRHLARKVTQEAPEPCSKAWFDIVRTHAMRLRLANCLRGTRRCGRVLCPLCQREFRRWMVGQILEQFAPSNGPIFFVTLIPTQRKLPPDRLSELRPAHLKDALRKQLVRGGLRNARVVGRIDISFNENTRREWSPHWQPHLHLIVCGCSEAQLRFAFKAAYRADISCPRPVRIHRIDGKSDLVRVISYVFRPYFDRRLSYVNAHRGVRTLSCGLKIPQLRELTRALSHFPIIPGFTFMQGLRRQGGKLVTTVAVRDYHELISRGQRSDFQ